MSKRKLILDVDTGTDDAVAIMMAAQRPEFDLVACTAVWGNLAIEHTTANTIRVLDHVGRSDVPVYRGLGRPLVPHPFGELPGTNKSKGRIHVDRLPLPDSGRQAEQQTAVEFLVETLRSATDPITLVPVGPLTNIAAAVTVAPEIVEAVDQVVIMGGAHAFGNVTPSAEINIWKDPAAASTVLGAGFERVVIMPLDATHEAFISSDESARLRATGTPAAVAAADFIDQRIAGYDDTQPMDEPGTAPVHDALCIAYLLDPDVVSLVHCPVAIETASQLTYGRTVFDVRRRGSGTDFAHVALHADRNLFAQLLSESLTLQGLANSGLM